MKVVCWIQGETMRLPMRELYIETRPYDYPPPAVVLPVRDGRDVRVLTFVRREWNSTDYDLCQQDEISGGAELLSNLGLIDAMGS